MKIEIKNYDIVVVKTNPLTGDQFIGNSICTLSYDALTDPYYARAIIQCLYHIHEFPDITDAERKEILIQMSDNDDYKRSNK